MLTLLFQMVLNLALAAPVPATSSSALISESLNIYKSGEGFSISSGSSEWRPELLGEQGLFNVVQFAPQLSTSDDAALTVRVDHLKKDQELAEYTKSWLKDYGHYGFDVLRVKRVKINNTVGVVIDLSHPRHKKMLRQVVFLKDQKAVVLTCKDSTQKFSSSLPSCNEIIKSFTWNPSSAIAKDQVPEISPTLAK